MNNLQSNKIKNNKLSNKRIYPRCKYNKKKILEHWQNIPIIKEIPENRIFNLTNQEIRSAILDILRNGIKEYDDLSDSVLIRHVFSVKELKKLINEKLNKKIKISNVHFHLNILKEKGLIEIVASTKEGRQTNYFYGRSARLFVGIEDDQNLMNIEDNSIHHHLLSLLLEFNTDLSEHEIKILYESLLQSFRANHERIRLWTEQNIDLFLNINIDTRLIYKFLKSIDIGTPDELEIKKKVTRLLKFNTS